MSYAKSLFLANLTRDPELTYTPSGLAVCKIGIAVNRKWKSESGEAKESVSFFDLKAFGKQAETIGQYMRKGHQAFFDCRPDVEQWEDKQTQAKRSRVVFVVEQFQFVNNKGDGQATERPQPAPAEKKEWPKPNRDEDMPPQEEDSIPF